MFSKWKYVFFSSQDIKNAMTLSGQIESVNVPNIDQDTSTISSEQLFTNESINNEEKEEKQIEYQNVY